MFKFKKGILKRAIFASTIFTNPLKYMEFANNSEVLTVKFGGEKHEIDSDTLVVSLVCLSKILQEINSELNPEEKLRIKIQATKEGSFEIFLGILITNLTKHIFTGEPSDRLKAIKNTLIQIFDLKRKLGDKKPKSVEQHDDGIYIQIEENNAPIIISKPTYHIYQKDEVREALGKTFNQIQKEEGVTDLELGEGTPQPLLVIPRAEFSEMATDVNLSDEETRTVVLDNAKIEVRKIAFENRTWEFTYKNRKIRAKLNDDDFFDNVQKGEKFGKGDILRVKMEVKQEIDEYGLHHDKEYTIAEVHSHTSREDTMQDKLFG